MDYAFYQTESGKYLLFFKSGQADAMTACFSEYSRKVLDKAKSRQPTIPEQMKQAEQQLAKEKPPKEHIKEVYHGIEDIPTEHRIFAYPKLNIREQMAAYKEVIDRSSLEGERLHPRKEHDDR